MARNSDNEWKAFLLEYYEEENVEHDRLYDTTNPKSFYLNQSRLDCIFKLLNKTQGSLLDVGCGSGFLLERLSREAGLPLYGFDLSRQKLQYIRNKFPNGKIALFQGDAESLPFKDSSFDVVLCTDMIEHVLYPLDVMREISRVCKRFAVISTPTNTSLYRLLKIALGMEVKMGGTHINELTQSELLKACHDAGFIVKEVIATPLIEFPGMRWVTNKKMFWAKLTYKLNKYLLYFHLIRRFGIVTCVLLEKRNHL